MKVYRMERVITKDIFADNVEEAYERFEDADELTMTLSPTRVEEHDCECGGYYEMCPCKCHDVEEEKAKKELEKTGLFKEVSA